MPRTQNNEDARSDSIASPGTSNEVCRLTTKYPPFWHEEPIIWFAQVEGHFMNAGITADLTKYNYVIAQLDQTYLREVKDIIVNPPTTGKYEILKQSLSNVYQIRRAETKATSHARGTWRPQTFAISPPLTRPRRS
ncbi:hypothetical protein EVAR_46833_1 [Eumeta japonica]|uniref:DUF7041 domain-containing protein n=1 Tax=Eumeta variegata TaxID=151549 RepID=A0A4C2A7Q5_EUMVA|nr:hypothetical protein EVAR_46833_1 [Eumeta japonica]